MSESSADGKRQLVLEVPSRGCWVSTPRLLLPPSVVHLVVNHLYLDDRVYGSLGTGLVRGKLVANDSGKATSYALNSILARGTLSIVPGDEVYSGMVIGKNAKAGALQANPIQGKEKRPTFRQWPRMRELLCRLPGECL
jgi:GTP-binding protein